MPGPLERIRIIEFAGIGPGPFYGMMLADQRAEVIRLDRVGQRSDPFDILGRSRKSIMIDTKKSEGVALARDLCRTAGGRRCWLRYRLGVPSLYGRRFLADRRTRRTIFRRQCQRLAELFGSRFLPPQGLVAMAEKGGKFVEARLG